MQGKLDEAQQLHASSMKHFLEREKISRNSSIVYGIRDLHIASHISAELME